MADPFGTIFDGVTLNRDLSIPSGLLIVTNGLTLNGVLTLTSDSFPATLRLTGTQTLAGTGQVVFTGTNQPGSVLPVGGTLTIGAGITVHGALGIVGDSSLPLINQGTISADVAGGTITIRANPFTNTGTTNQLNGGKLVVNP
jgi:hypothetical protein